MGAKLICYTCGEPIVGGYGNLTFRSHDHEGVGLPKAYNFRVVHKGDRCDDRRENLFSTGLYPNCLARLQKSFNISKDGKAWLKQLGELLR